MTITPDSHIYRKAFENYLRKGITPDVFIKATFDSPFYIWRTQHDDKVRASHAANEGRVCAWEAPPDTGNPGSDFGCRCYAEPVDISKIASAALLTILATALLLKVPAARRAAILAARELARRKILKPNEIPVEKPPEPNTTAHGSTRIAQRQISAEETQKAIRTAEQTGNVTTKIGKYGTPQKVYTGTNSVTVVTETTGRNAGKIITVWRNQ